LLTLDRYAPITVCEGAMRSETRLGNIPTCEIFKVIQYEYVITMASTDDKNSTSTFRRSPTLNSSHKNYVTTVTTTFESPSLIISNDRLVTIRRGTEVSVSRDSAVVSYGQSEDLALDVPLLQNNDGEESKALHRKLNFACKPRRARRCHNLPVMNVALAAITNHSAQFKRHHAGPMSLIVATR
jgi:hypothetical protein